MLLFHRILRSVINDTQLFRLNRYLLILITKILEQAYYQSEERTYLAQRLNGLETLQQ